MMPDAVQTTTIVAFAVERKFEEERLQEIISWHPKVMATKRKLLF